MKNPKITVYIVSYNLEKYLEDAIESVLRQNIDNWELLLIDDNSSDKTWDIIKRYNGDQRIKSFKTEGIGLPSICNLALKEAKGEYFIRLDGDDIFDENILLVLSHYLDNHENCALVFPDYYLIDEFNDIFSHERRQKVFDINHMVDLPPNGACTLMRKKVICEIGGYREDLGAQDGFDIWSRIAQNYKYANINLPLFYYRRHNDNLTNKTHFIINARQQIKKDSIADKLNNYHPIIVVIPCRKNYDFCSDLWSHHIGSKTLLEYAIDECIASDIFDHIIVACDNPDAKEIMKKYKDQRLQFYLRKSKDTIRSKKIVPMLEEITNKYDPLNNGITVIRYIQSPFVTKETMEESICTLIMNDADTALGVEEINRLVFKKTPHGLELINPQREFRTEFDTVYHEANTAIATRNKIISIGSLLGSRVSNFIVVSDESFFINNKKMLDIAQIMFEQR